MIDYLFIKVWLVVLVVVFGGGLYNQHPYTTLAIKSEMKRLSIHCRKTLLKSKRSTDNGKSDIVGTGSRHEYIAFEFSRGTCDASEQYVQDYHLMCHDVSGVHSGHASSRNQQATTEEH